MKVYEVTYRKGWGSNEQTSKMVLAKDAGQAIDHMDRWVKKNYVSNYQVLAVKKVLDVDVFYK